jgi:hypothetical protein
LAGRNNNICLVTLHVSVEFLSAIKDGVPKGYVQGAGGPNHYPLLGISMH